MNEEPVEFQPSAEVRWNSDTGFEFDFASCSDDVVIQIMAIPLPADGTIELMGGPLELDRLEILFKARVDIDENPGQIREATVEVTADFGGYKLVLVAQIEDVETGQVFPFSTSLPVEIPQGVPKAGGPRPVLMAEDDLDWDDEATLERMVVDLPDNPTVTEQKPIEERPTGGIGALLDALSAISEEDLVDENKVQDKAEVHGEAARFLQLLIQRDDLELEEDRTIEELVDGVGSILHSGASELPMAVALSEWLLEQDAVADLFIDDDSLAGLLAQW
jgi:hypothetical protein